MIINDLIVGIVANLISNHLSRKDEKKNIITETVNNNSNENETVIKSLTYIEQISKRLQYTIEMLNLNYDKLSFSKICDYLNYKSVSLIEDYFFAKKEPSLAFIMNYSNFFGLEYNWLRHGEGNIFQRLKKSPKYPIDYESTILDLQPQSIYFVRSKSKEGKSGIVLKLTKLKYTILPRTYYISSNVGNTGENQIVSFYELIKSLTKSFSYFQINGLILTKNEFDELFNGEIYPGKLLDKYRQANHWWEDFLDIDHKHPTFDNYENFYGEEFIKAQEIIKLKKEKRCA